MTHSGLCCLTDRVSSTNFLNFLKITIQSFQNAYCGAFSLFDDSEKKMFYANVIEPDEAPLPCLRR